jgi:hypothetical protein
MTHTLKFCVDNILSGIMAAKPACDPCRRLVLQKDNAFPHGEVFTTQKLEENGSVASRAHRTLRSLTFSLQRIEGSTGWPQLSIGR